MKVFYTCILLCVLATKASACICTPFKDIKAVDYYSYENSDLVVVAYITAITSKDYQITIKKVLKGKSKLKKIYGTYSEQKGYSSSCKFAPKQTGEYLLYLNKTNYSNKHYYSSQCKGNRSIKDPTTNRYLEDYPIDKAKALTEETIKIFEAKQ